VPSADRTAPCMMSKILFASLLSASLAASGCERTKASEADRGAVSSLLEDGSSTPASGRTASGSVTLSDAAPAALSPSAAGGRASASAASAADGDGGPFEDCRPLSQPPNTERRRLPQEGPYGSGGNYLHVTSVHEAVSSQINDAIAKDLVTRKRNFRKDADELVTTSEGQDPLTSPARMRLDIRCDEALATTRLLSIECDAYANLGGAHPNDTRFTYDFATCQRRATRLTLSTLCRPDRSWKTEILDLIEQDLDHKLGPGFVKLDDYSSALDTFVVTKTGLRFFANDLPHVVASAGTIDIGFARLKSVLRGMARSRGWWTNRVIGKECAQGSRGDNRG
jgi:hypothetical protein